MNEVEKMYENAGIKTCKRKQGFTLKDCTDRDCKECGYYNIPPFTAEKQLEIIKFMFHKGIYYDTDGNTYWFHYTDEIENASYKPFDEAIAEFINHLWQDLTEEERKQIKNILEE